MIRQPRGGRGSLRERGGGNGRVYTIYYTATDSHGAQCSGSLEFCVAERNRGACVNDGPPYDSTACPGSGGGAGGAQPPGLELQVDPPADPLRCE